MLDVSAGQGAGHHAPQEGLRGALHGALLSGQTPECLHVPQDALQDALQSKLLGERAHDLLALMCTKENTRPVTPGHLLAPVGPLTPEAILHIHVHLLAPPPPHTPAPPPVPQDPGEGDPTPQHPGDLDPILGLQEGGESAEGSHRLLIHHRK